MSLVARKRRRTRQTLVEAATALFKERGFVETTIADIAAAADISKRAFFSHFPSKEDLLFPEGDARLRAALDAIATRSADDGPAEVLLRALQAAGEASDDLVSPLAALRLRLIRTVPSVRGRALLLQLDAQREIARQLAAAFPEQLDEVSAAALTGAFLGAVTGALEVLFENPARLGSPADIQATVRQATAVALRPWMRG